MDNREQVIASFFKQVMKQQTVDVQDPNYLIIEDILKVFTTDQLNGLYELFITTEKYHTKGFTSIVKLKEAISDFKEAEMESIWKKHKVYEKARELAEKLNSLFNSIYFSSKGAQDIVQACSNFKIEKVKNAANGETLFNQEEQEIIKDISLYAIYKLHEESGKVFLIDFFEKTIKNRLTKERFSKQDKLMIESYSKDEKVNKSVSLLAMKMKA